MKVVPLRSLFENLIKLGVKTTREDFYNISIDGNLAIDLTVEQLCTLKQKLSKHFMFSTKEIIVK